jgi:cobalt-zinc-cadmium efflux system outer membrane protein
MSHSHQFACTLFFGLVLAAQGSQPASRIDDLVGEALAGNAELQEAAAGVAEAKGKRIQAGSMKNPEISVEFGGREVRDSENILQGNGTTFTVGIMQRFEFPGKGTLRKAIANKNIEIAELGLEQFRIALAGRVRMLALEHLAAAEEERAAEAISRQSSELAEHLNRQADLGALLKLELRVLQAGVVEQSETIKQSALRREETRTQLNALLGRPQNHPLHIDDALVPATRTFHETALVLSAQRNNLLLKIRHSEVERSSKELTTARLDIAPDLAIGPFFSRDVAGDTEQNLGGAISASVPLWDWNIGNIRSAQARQSAAKAIQVRGERDTEAQILSLLKSYELTRRQLAMAPSGFLKGIQEASALAGSQFRNGSIGVQLYMDTQSAYWNSLKISHRAILDAWSAYLDINLLTAGRLDAPAASSTSASPTGKKSHP